MLRQYIIVTRLVSIIQAIQLSRETGVLVAKRGEGNSVEEGSIVFDRGRITEVKMSRSNVSDAFNQMSTWENCLVSFLSQDPLKTTMSLFENSPIETGGLSETQKLEIPPPLLPKGVRPAHDHHESQTKETQKLEIPPPLLPKGVRPAHDHHESQLNDTPPTLNPSSPLSFTEQEPVSYVPLLIQPLQSSLRQIEQSGLSRAHRQIALLIDGKRSVEDLANGVGRTVKNVQDILQDLKRMGMI